MTMARVELITSVQRRRRCSREEKKRIVAAWLEPGVVLSEVARREGIHSSVKRHPELPPLRHDELPPLGVHDVG